MARRLEAVDRLWEAIGRAEGGDRVGLCLDTCHAHAGGIDLTGVVERVRAVTGRIDLVHANDSRDDPDSGADRHTNLGSGRVDADALAAVVSAAGAPVVVETPGGVGGQSADIAWLRARVDR
jgi:deoxyribonuclease-4